VADSNFPRSFTVNSWIEDNPPKLNGLEKETNVSERMNNGTEPNRDRATPSNIKKNVKKRKIDSKTQNLLNSSRKLGRRLISMDLESEKRDTIRTRKSNQAT